ncbi:MAG: hypothetical protein NTU94_05695 [Planctomycetota bacterium]|nr:hypothetical protein [Planctomycetota bacterium]
MYRFALVVLTFVACLVWAGSTALAEGGDEFQLPPVKLKPDRPTQAKPIPPTPDERAAPPAETPKEPPPAEKPPAPPKVAPPAEKAPEPPKVAPPVLAPKAPPEEPVEAPKKPPETPKKPPTLELPTEPPAEPTLPPVLAKPATAPAKTARPVELPPEPALPPPVTPKPAKAPDLALPPAGQEPRRTAVQKELVEAQVEPQPAVDLAGMGEVGLVEEVSRTRKAYARALTALKDYYVSRANVAKIQWIDSELAAFDKVPKIQYLVVAELAGPNLRPTRHIEAADQLYKEGINYKDYPAFPPGKKEYLKVALEKFQTIIEKYPESDKIADAAFRMGEIYGGWYFEDWARAVQSYERCWQWDPATPNPALFNAAKIYDDKLKNRVKAVELYNRVVAESKIEDHVNQAQDRIRALTGK